MIIHCATKEVRYRGDIIENAIVNLDLCKSISKSKFAWYPDNKGLPSIRFNGCDVEWVFEHEIIRDATYNALATEIKIPGEEHKA